MQAFVLPIYIIPARSNGAIDRNCSHMFIGWFTRRKQIHVRTTLCSLYNFPQFRVVNKTGNVVSQNCYDGRDGRMKKKLKYIDMPSAKISILSILLPQDVVMLDSSKYFRMKEIRLGTLLK